MAPTWLDLEWSGFSVWECHSKSDSVCYSSPHCTNLLIYQQKMRKLPSVLKIKLVPPKWRRDEMHFYLADSRVLLFFIFSQFLNFASVPKSKSLD